MCSQISFFNTATLRRNVKTGLLSLLQQLNEKVKTLLHWQSRELHWSGESGLYEFDTSVLNKWDNTEKMPDCVRTPQMSIYTYSQGATLSVMRLYTSWTNTGLSSEWSHRNGSEPRESVSFTILERLRSSILQFLAIDQQMWNWSHRSRSMWRCWFWSSYMFGEACS